MVARRAVTDMTGEIVYLVSGIGLVLSNAGRDEQVQQEWFVAFQLGRV